MPTEIANVYVDRRDKLLSEIDFDFLKERYVIQQGNEISFETVKRQYIEYLIAYVVGSSLGTKTYPPLHVEAFWRLHLLETKSYRDVEKRVIEKCEEIGMITLDHIDHSVVESTTGREDRLKHTKFLYTMVLGFDDFGEDDNDDGTRDTSGGKKKKSGGGRDNERLKRSRTNNGNDEAVQENAKAIAKEEQKFADTNEIDRSKLPRAIKPQGEQIENRILPAINPQGEQMENPILPGTRDKYHTKAYLHKQCPLVDGTGAPLKMPQKIKKNAKQARCIWCSRVDGIDHRSRLICVECGYGFCDFKTTNRNCWALHVRHNGPPPARRYKTYHSSG